ncbi:lysophospholipid acyltransferase family protein [Colwellia sp. E2M01]|uniref:lysophospholipid acyltransferase family protein n=1 Tax=Colwellia sp. E2M01 TaxID=2841561 RepID=UPI001C0969FC|nr:lysophospholipid acyltransferase family protein [Colwellia sp. E2M01]MBU2871889.1 lysophospholipid acyltransferase family protein [Colwellia sp. E2M01]
MINVDSILNEQLPTLQQSPKLEKTVRTVCKKLLHEEEINTFLNDHAHLGASNFLDHVMQRLGLSFLVNNWELENIPTSGRVVIIANHPLGSLDGIALLKMVSQVRSDIKIVANEILSNIEPLESYFLPVDNMKGRAKKEQYQAIEQSLNTEEAVIFFPAGEVSRWRLDGIKDNHWRTGFLRIAKKTQSPILPIYVGGKNSKFFYGLSLLSKPMSVLLLVKEMFRTTKITVPMTIGEIIPFSQIDKLPTNLPVSAQLFRKHVYTLNSRKKNKGGGNQALVFETEKPIAAPQQRQHLLAELAQCERLSSTDDGKESYLLTNAKDTRLLNEIGRLRELSFRTVGEGTGCRIDTDEYDNYYHHIILWDPKQLEIVGAYRVVPTKDIAIDKLYSSTLFNYQENIKKIKPQGLEMGRSFVQPKYRGKRSLDYLWNAIGAYLIKFPELRYLFGPVSISADYKKELHQWLVFYYLKYYGSKDNAKFYNLAQAKLPLLFTDAVLQDLTEQFAGLDHKEGFKLLKSHVKLFNMAVPTLLKQYTELCDPEHVNYCAFNIDPLFNNCIDGLVMVDSYNVLQKKSDKYFPGRKINQQLIT